MSKRSVGIRIVHVSLNLDDAIIKNQFTGNIQDIKRRNLTTLKIPVNGETTLEKKLIGRSPMSFFSSVVSPLTGIFRLFRLFVQHKHLMLDCRRTCNLTMISSVRKSSNQSCSTNESSDP